MNQKGGYPHEEEEGQEGRPLLKFPEDAPPTIAEVIGGIILWCAMMWLLWESIRRDW